MVGQDRALHTEGRNKRQRKPSVGRCCWELEEGLEKGPGSEEEAVWGDAKEEQEEAEAVYDCALIEDP